MKIIIIGGVAAGMSCASRLKRNRKDYEIIVYEKGNELSYGACGIPFYVADSFEDETALIAKTKEQFEKEQIQVHTYHEVLHVDEKKKQVKVKNLLKDEVFETSYDKLVIASGARVNRFAPLDKPYQNLYEVRNVQDGVRLKNILKEERIKNIVVVGAGFIGLELCEAASKYNKQITLIEAGDQILNVVDKEIAQDIEIMLEEHKITVVKNTIINALSIENKEIKEVYAESDHQQICIACDMVINCAGIKPATDFIPCVDKLANGAIKVNEHMQTNVKDIYAAGDCSAMKAYLTKQYSYSPLGTNANKQGRIIADVIAEKNHPEFKLIGSSAMRLFEKDVAKVGLNEKEAAKAGLNYKVNKITANSYASYYGKEQLDIKLIYHPETKQLYGAQLIGQGIVVPRANYYAIAIAADLSLDAFGYLDFCYSPPFSGVWDAALIAANTSK